ncbi:MAG: nitroreductase family protein [Planctomycetes bacterium]|nr:nitroreductase family protein [Planctomycetota bacterium]
MNIYEIIKTRKSIRNYKADSVPEEKLMNVLEAARLAPSGKNGQPWRFVVVKDKKIREALVDACKGQKYFIQAPVAIIACGSDAESYQKQGGYMTSMVLDIGIAMEHLVLAATEEGLGTCWIGAFNENDVRKILNVPSNLRVVALTPLGFPDETPAPKPRKELKDIVIENRF